MSNPDELLEIQQKPSLSRDSRLGEVTGPIEIDSASEDADSAIMELLEEEKEHTVRCYSFNGVMGGFTTDCILS